MTLITLKEKDSDTEITLFIENISWFFAHGDGGTLLGTVDGMRWHVEESVGTIKAKAKEWLNMEKSIQNGSLI